MHRKICKWVAKIHIGYCRKTGWKIPERKVAKIVAVTVKSGKPVGCLLYGFLFCVKMFYLT